VAKVLRLLLPAMSLVLVLTLVARTDVSAV
jgi:hypothetical protein